MRLTAQNRRTICSLKWPLPKLSAITAYQLVEGVGVVLRGGKDEERGLRWRSLGSQNPLNSNRRFRIERRCSLIPDIVKYFLCYWCPDIVGNAVGFTHANVDRVCQHIWSISGSTHWKVLEERATPLYQEKHQKASSNPLDSPYDRLQLYKARFKVYRHQKSSTKPYPYQKTTSRTHHQNGTTMPVPRVPLRSQHLETTYAPPYKLPVQIPPARPLRHRSGAATLALAAGDGGLGFRHPYGYDDDS